MRYVFCGNQNIQLDEETQSVTIKWSLVLTPFMPFVLSIGLLESDFPRVAERARDTENDFVSDGMNVRGQSANNL
jgi:hypothetical protein